MRTYYRNGYRVTELKKGVVIEAWLVGEKRHPSGYRESGYAIAKLEGGGSVFVRDEDWGGPEGLAGYLRKLGYEVRAGV